MTDENRVRYIQVSHELLRDALHLPKNSSIKVAFTTNEGHAFDYSTFIVECDNFSKIHKHNAIPVVVPKLEKTEEKIVFVGWE